VETKEDDSPIADIRRMIRIINELKRSLKRTYKNNSINSKRTWIKIL
jgi:hypothetical protein